MYIGLAIFIFVFGIGWWYNDTQYIVDDKYKYYVNLFESKDAQKNYRVPAEIIRSEDGIDLSEVYWSNGGTTTFYDENAVLKVGERIYTVDDKGEEWYVELTKMKVDK